MIASDSVRRQFKAGNIPATAAYTLVILVTGIAYRVAFIYQGWSATDEGFLQAAGARIASGQVPYRDFEYLLPPVTIYKEGALAALLGNGWTVLASRWLFSVEVSVASVLAFLILRRFVSDRIAFLATLPTIFFSVMILAFTNYTYDGEFMALLSIMLAVNGADTGGRSRALALAAGVAAGLAAMSKSPFLALVPAIPLAALGGAWLRRRSGGEVPPGIRALQRGWPLYVAGCVLTIAAFFAYFAVVGTLGRFVDQAFLLSARAHPVSLRFALYQDLPDYVVRFGRLVPGLVAIIILLLPLRFGRAWEVIRTVLLIAVLAYVLDYTLLRGEIPSRPLFINVAYFVISLLGLAALGLVVILEGPWLRQNETAAALRNQLLPPEIVFLALYLQWLAQFHYDGLVFWYMGSFLSVPVVLVFVHALSRVSIPLYRSARHLRWGMPLLAPLVFALWLSVGGAGIFLERVYQDADRPQLTATFAAPKLHGISTYPVTAQRVDGIVAEVNRLTKPGDPVFFLPDFGILYSVTGRINPTPIDWYNEAFLTPAVTDEVLAALKRDPPKLVFLQTQREGAWQRDQIAIDYASSRWSPIVAWLLTHYQEAGTVQDVLVLVPAAT